ncbi:MAG: clostripain-related cysteine peptidase [Acidobacteriota bacterium]
MSETKEWTVMFYFASDNPLAPTIVSQLKAIKDAGFHPEANVIAQFDPHTLNTPAHVFDINLVEKLNDPDHSDVGFGANDPYVRNLVLDKLWGEKEESIRERVKRFLETRGKDNSGEMEPDESRKIVYDPPRPSAAMSGEQNPRESLSNFLNFCRESYPARHYALFILGHGEAVGDDYFLFDENAIQHSLLLTELGEVLRTFKCNIADDEQPGQFELVGFHSCSMSSIEAAYELKGTANYMLASQGPAYVGSWPYKQILIRVFNDLKSYQIKAREIQHKENLARRFKAAADPVSESLVRRFGDKTRELLNLYDDSTAPDRSLLYALLDELNILLEDPELRENEQLRAGQLSEETKQLLGQRPRGTAGKWLNRMLLRDNYPEIKDKEKPTVKGMLTKIFYYCLYNSYDFQLAGYSFDLCLCDLNKVPEIKVPLKTLSDTLTEGLTDPVVRQLILLAHWDAQSFWQEGYADLYDFCFRLQRRCNELFNVPKPEPTDEIRQAPEIRQPFKGIWSACEIVMHVLRRGSKDRPDQLIVRSAFAGPAFQYSHGLSILFPWAEPVGSELWDEQYAEYKLNKKTGWQKFLKKSFVETRRPTNLEEDDPKDQPVVNRSLSSDVLALVEEISARVFNDEGQLGRDGPDDPLGKNGPDDPTGGNCNCPTIKNYPLFTRSRNEDVGDDEKGIPETRQKIPVSPTFFEQFGIE